MAKQFPDIEWDIGDASGNIGTWERVQVAVLMDIRREMRATVSELRRLNAMLSCTNFQRIPLELKQIACNTKKPKRKRSRP